jgi:spermidine/putrescine transport system ATP-binding protein
MQSQSSSNDAPPASTPATFAIEARGLTRRFGEVTALDGVSLDIREGEFLSLLGPSGCGKTTLLRLIAGLDLPDAGELKIHGESALPIPAHRRPVNTVFQNYALFPHLRVWDNIAFGLRMKNVAPPEIETRVRRVMDLVEISNLADRKPAQISGGQKQRVALARALVNEPEVLLLDEPLGALDLKLRKQLQLELHRLQRRLGITFVYVTHDQDEAMVMSDRIAVMNAGRIEQLGAPEEIYEQPRTRFVAEFLGSCNFIEGEVCLQREQEISVKSAWGEFVVALPREQKFSNQKITLTIRPEKIQIGEGSANRVQARIQEIVFSGAETHFLAQCGSQEIRVCRMNSQAEQSRLAVGDEVQLSFPAASLKVLEG